MSITYLTYPEIDKQKWDDCIDHSQNRLIYAKSFYLDAMAKHWDALVLNDYEAVMPLTWKKKWGVRYLYQPSFIQQGGIFFISPLRENILYNFFELLTNHFKFAEITLNYANVNLTLPPHFKKTERNNYILPLHTSYEMLYENYQPHFTKSLRRIKKFNLKYRKATDFVEVIETYKTLFAHMSSTSLQKDFESFKIICGKLFEEDKVIIRQVCSEEGKLFATVLLLKDAHRLYNIISFISKEGKRAEANYYLYDRIIEEFCNSSLVLDMEGSDIKGVADFYLKINPSNQMYPAIQYNKLPFLVKAIKN